MTNGRVVRPIAPHQRRAANAMVRSISPRLVFLPSNCSPAGPNAAHNLRAGSARALLLLQGDDGTARQVHTCLSDSGPPAAPGTSVPKAIDRVIIYQTHRLHESIADR